MCIMYAQTYRQSSKSDLRQTTQYFKCCFSSRWAISQFIIHLAIKTVKTRYRPHIRVDIKRIIHLLQFHNSSYKIKIMFLPLYPSYTRRYWTYHLLHYNCFQLVIQQFLFRHNLTFFVYCEYYLLYPALPWNVCVVCHELLTSVCHLAKHICPKYQLLNCRQYSLLA